MQLIYNVKSKYWIFSAISFDEPLNSVMNIYATREEALKDMDTFLPLDIELRTIQSLAQTEFEDEYISNNLKTRTRTKILEDGYFYNPFGTVLAGENYNGYFSVYMVKPIYSSNDARISYETVKGI